MCRIISGMNALRHAIAPLAKAESLKSGSTDATFFSQVRIGGGHLNCVQMVAIKEVDVAAIDCVTFSLISRYYPDLVVHFTRRGESLGI